MKIQLLPADQFKLKEFQNIINNSNRYADKIKVIIHKNDNDCFIVYDNGPCI